LQIRPTLSVLALLRDKHLLSDTTVEELSAAYIFLRNLEHRLQYAEDKQTQTLPTNDEGKKRLALAMSFESWTALQERIETYRNTVDKHFGEVFSDPKGEQAADVGITEIWQATIDDTEAISRIKALNYLDAQQTLMRLRGVLHSAKYKQLPELSRRRFDVLMPLVIKLAAKEHNPDMALLRVSDLLESICRRASYLALLAEYPAALNCCELKPSALNSGQGQTCFNSGNENPFRFNCSQVHTFFKSVKTAPASIALAKLAGLQCWSFKF
jgi:glutamate-ammonia-ligase adenylyltransferase